MTETQTQTIPESPEKTSGTSPRTGSFWSRFKILIRRVHLYSGLFMLPWVFLYGITGAMFNHQGLFPQFEFQTVDDAVVAKSDFAQFPSAEQLAQQVVETLQTAADGASVSLAENHGAEFTNNLMFEMNDAGTKHIVHLDPASKTSYVVSQLKNPETPEVLLSGIRNIKLDASVMNDAKNAAAEVFDSVGIKGKGQPRPFGWTKLNFLASVDGELARVTYVLKDGHVDVTRFTGDDGYTTRAFFLRLHTAHGQPPHWNGRMFWSLCVDAMAIAMVCWGLTGIFMWWQLKRTRMVGGLVIVASVAIAAVMYFSVHDFYAATKM